MAGTKTVSVALSLQDKFTAPMKKAADSTKNFQKAGKLASLTMKDIGRNLGNAAASAAKAATAFAAVTAAASVVALKKFGDEAVELAKAQIDAETKLEALLGNIPSVAAGGTNAIKNAKAELLDYASAVQSVGVVGDEVLISGMQQLATYQLSTDTIKQLTSGMADLLVQTKGLDATQGDAVNAANMLGKVMSGQTGALSRAGIIFSDAQKKILQTGNEMERAATLAEVLAANVGGVNKAMASTDQGKLRQFSNAWGDLKENIGKPIIAAQAALADVAIKFLPNIESMLTKIFGGITAGMMRVSEFLDSNIAGVSTIFDTLEYIVDAISKGISTGISRVNISTESWAGFINLIKGAADGLAEVLGVAIPLALDVITRTAEGIYGIVTLIVDGLKWVVDHIQKIGDVLSNAMPLSETNYSHAAMGENELGTPYWKGGLTRVNERGGEIVNLPSGAQIIPHDVSTKMASGTNVSLNLTIQGNVIGNQEYAEELGSYITSKVVMALGVV